MLAFVTSIRARALARDWDQIEWLLQNCLRSICRQSSMEWRAFVVCHDVPQIAQDFDSRVQWLTTDIRLPERTFEDMTTDKAIKCTQGIQAAVQAGARHVMLVDADDLIHKDICAAVSAGPDACGYYVAQGFSHFFGSGLVRPIPEFDRICGTSLILRSDLIRFEKDGRLRNAVIASMLTIGHPNVRAHFEQQGTPLSALPFPGAIYVQHPDSAVAIQNEGWRPVSLRQKLGLIRRQVLRLSQSSWITAAVRESFALPARSEIPPRWRASWWRV